MTERIKLAIKWLKANSKLAIIITTTALIVLFLWNNQIKINRLEKTNQLQQVELSTYKDSVSIYRSKNGDLTFKLKSVEVELSNRKEALELAGFEIKDLKARDIKWRKVNFALQAQIESQGSGTVELHDTTYIPIKGDTVLAKVGEWSNKYLYLTPFIVGNKMDFKYKYQTQIKVIRESSNTVSIALTDPLATITGSNSITIKNKLRWYKKPYVWGIGGLITGFFIFK